MPDKQSEDRLFAALNKTIGKIESNQQADGTFAGNAGWASVLSQGICSKALSRASQKGVAVKTETIKRDLDQTVAQLAPSKAAPGLPAASSPPALAASGPALGRGGVFVGGFASGGATSGKGDAGVELYSLAANGSRVQDTVNANQFRKKQAEAIVNSPTADDKTKDAARGELKEVAAAEQANGVANKQLAASIGSAKFVSGFGNNGGEEFLSYMNISETLLVQGGEAWEKWDRQACETIIRVARVAGLPRRTAVAGYVGRIFNPAAFQCN